MKEKNNLPPSTKKQISCRRCRQQCQKGKQSGIKRFSRLKAAAAVF